MSQFRKNAVSRFLTTIGILLAATGARAATSACVAFLVNENGSAKAQYSCDGGELKELFPITGITVGISKAIPHFTAQGYRFHSCSDAVASDSRGFSSAHARCIFTKQD